VREPFGLPAWQHRWQARHGWLLMAGGLAGSTLLILCGIALQRQLRSPSAPQPGSRQLPAPPAQAAWVSPLQTQCSVNDPALAGRLNRLRQALPQRLQRIRIDPSNFGDRFREDAFGNRLDVTPSMVVMHETVYGLNSAINTFLTHHPNDDDQVSYHVLIGEKGQIVQAVDPSKRAFGAGNSAFNGRWVVTNAKLSGSVNNFALHLSLETPLDGEDDGPAHSGYTAAQYDALAVVLADWMDRFAIPPEHITTHRHVDLGLERADPRSFDWQKLQIRLAALGFLC
jgi:hypothetical protein